MTNTAKKVKKVDNRDVNEKLVQSSLKNFVYEQLETEKADKKNENHAEYDSEEERFVKEMEKSIEMDIIGEKNANELFLMYKLKVERFRERNVNNTDTRAEINADRSKIVSALKWCLNRINISEYRVGQEEAIHRLVCDRKDVVLILPTGGGKSLTYQLPSLLREYQKNICEIPSISKGMVTVVVSPLIALIEDQINSLKRWGIKSNGLSTAIVQKSYEGQSVNKALDELYLDLSRKTPQNSIIYITPESLGTEKVLNCIYNLYVNKNLFCFAIDEAHCISEWGHDFRVAYRRLSNIKDIFSEIPVLACTATASPKVQEDILNVLKLRNPYISINSFNRPNIHYTVYNVDNNDYLSGLSQEEIILHGVLYMNNYFNKLNEGKYKDKQDNSAFEKSYQSGHNDLGNSKENVVGIVYVNKRKSSETLSKYLNDHGITSRCYHAGLSLKLRTEIQNEWLKDKIQVLVGTIAFGMGVHKPNVRFVIHSSIPESIDSYYQQSGRAGRDSGYSRAMLFYSRKDIQTLNCIKRKSLQYLYLKSKEKANMSYEKYQANLNSIIEFAQCNGKLGDECYQDYDYYDYYNDTSSSWNNSSSQNCNKNHIKDTNCQKPLDPVKYQLNLNKYGQCRRRHLLCYFGEKYCSDSNGREHQYSCCDVCDSKHNYKEELESSFLNYISKNKVVGSKNVYHECNFTRDFSKKRSVHKNQFEYMYEYDNYKENEFDDIRRKDEREYNYLSSSFSTAKSLLMGGKDQGTKTEFASALNINNELKKKGVSYLDRLKILEKEEQEMEMSKVAGSTSSNGIKSACIAGSVNKNRSKRRP